MKYTCMIPKHSLSIIFTILLFVLLSQNAKAQLFSVDENYMREGIQLALIGVDFYKTDIDRAFGKVQMGVEAGYFFNKRFMASGGLDLWTSRDEPIITIGSRYYAAPPFFIRQRAIIKDISDVSLGLGYSFLLNRQWLVECMSDYYLNQHELSFRVSFGYFWDTKKRP